LRQREYNLASNKVGGAQLPPHANLLLPPLLLVERFDDVSLYTQAGYSGHFDLLKYKTIDTVQA